LKTLQKVWNNAIELIRIAVLLVLMIIWMPIVLLVIPFVRWINNLCLTRGDSRSAWRRCLPIWSHDGGIDDWRGIGGQPFYSPSRGVMLARMFAKRHSSDAAIFLEFTQDDDPIAALCAIDLLREMASISPGIVPMLTASELPLSKFLYKTLTDDAERLERVNSNPTPIFDTVGSYFSWLYVTVDAYYRSEDESFD
jgi:hypothetical protein